MTSIIDFHTNPYLSGEAFLNFYLKCFTPSPKQCSANLERAGISMICGSVILKRAYCREDGFASIHRSNNRALELRRIRLGSPSRMD